MLVTFAASVAVLAPIPDAALFTTTGGPTTSGVPKACTSASVRNSELTVSIRTFRPPAFGASEKPNLYGDAAPSVISTFCVHTVAPPASSTDTFTTVVVIASQRLKISSDFTR